MATNEHYAKGKLLAQGKDYALALEAYNKALEVNPDDADILADRGVALFHLGKKHLAVLDLDKAQELEPENPYRYSSRAYIKDSLGDLEGAIADYKKAIALDPEDAIAHNNLGLLEEKLGRVDDSKVNFKKADQLADKLGLSIGNFEADQGRSAEELGSETPKEGYMRQVFSVFSSKERFDEFISFVRNGFKLK